MSAWSRPTCGRASAVSSTFTATTGLVLGRPPVSGLIAFGLGCDGDDVSVEVGGGSVAPVPVGGACPCPDELQPARATPRASMTTATRRSALTEPTLAPDAEDPLSGAQEPITLSSLR